MTPSRNVVVKAERLPRMGEKVVDEKLKQVGMIFDVFGPVSRPYVSIKSSTEDTKVLVNRSLYVVPSVRIRKESRRRD